MKLFSEDLGLIKTDEELVALQKQFPSYDPAYVCQSSADTREKVKSWMEGLWKKYEPYADKHFIEDFKHQFTQRSWELYLGATFLGHGFGLGKHKNAGPDFDVLEIGGKKRLAWVEAIAVKKGSGNDRVPDTVHGVVRSVPEEEMLLRLAHALKTKYEKYCEDIKSGLVKDDESYIIAVDRSELESVDPMIPLILKALFGIGHQTLSFPVPEKDSPPAEPKSGWSSQIKLHKKSGSDVAMLFFEDPKHVGISAVIYSKDHVINSPRLTKEFGENFSIIHNPNAKNPLPVGTFPFGAEYATKGEYLELVKEKKKYQTPDIFE